MRLFVALGIPDSVAQALMLIQGGVPGARWQTRAQLHLTLRFIGEVEGRETQMLDDALAAIRAPAFPLELHGVGQFGNKNSHSLWAGLRRSAPLLHLQRKVDVAIRRVAAPDDSAGHKFTPHVTLARLRHPETAKVLDWLTHHALFGSGEFRVGAFHLYSSRPGADGSIYARERDYFLEGGDGQIDD